MTASAPADDTASSAARDPLHGIRVLDFSAMVSGPYAGRFLADLGADVIKIEPPEGDYMRTREPVRNGASAYFGQMNAGKRSVALDLKNPAAFALVKRLIAESDVIVENFRPGVMKRLGLDYETLAAEFPRLVYCSVSGFGQTGPDALKPAYAQIVQAASGYDLAFKHYQDAMAKPPNSNLFVADVMAGMAGYAAVVTALFQRERTGRGQQIDLSLIEGMFCLMPYEIQEAQFPAKERRPVYPPMRASDGFVMISLVSPRNWEDLFKGMGIDDWRSDPMLGTNAARQANWTAVMQRIEAWTSQRTMAECLATLEAHGVPLTPYRTVREAIAEPQCEHRGSFAKVRDAGGDYRVPNLPFKFSAARVETRPVVPDVGAHTEQVLREVAGATAEELAALKPRR